MRSVNDLRGLAMRACAGWSRRLVSWCRRTAGRARCLVVAAASRALAAPLAPPTSLARVSSQVRRGSRGFRSVGETSHVLATHGHRVSEEGEKTRRAPSVSPLLPALRSPSLPLSPCRTRPPSRAWMERVSLHGGRLAPPSKPREHAPSCLRVTAVLASPTGKPSGRAPAEAAATQPPRSLRATLMSALRWETPRTGSVDELVEETAAQVSTLPECSALGLPPPPRPFLRACCWMTRFMEPWRGPRRPPAGAPEATHPAGAGAARRTHCLLPAQPRRAHSQQPGCS